MAGVEQMPRDPPAPVQLICAEDVPDIAVALIPFIAFCGLMAFRMIYFGDLLPNPFYAKSSRAGLTGLLNPMGAGWAYTMSGLRHTSLLLVLPLLLLIRVRPVPAWMIIAGAVLAGQAVFTIWAKGDWMSQYRFVMPILPILLLLAAMGLKELGALWRQAIFCCVAVLAINHTMIVQISLFSNRPTTPLAVVTDVGHTFRSLADRLEIEDPVLAHHDAGGIAYHRMIRLVDLGGLVNRTIAKNMQDRDFLTTYLVEEVRPDFVFGAFNFAAASGFAETETFRDAYVWLAFPDLPFMESDLSYIRRDLVAPRPGIEIQRDTDGTPLRVVVSGGG